MLRRVPRIAVRLSVPTSVRQWPHCAPCTGVVHDAPAIAKKRDEGKEDEEEEEERRLTRGKRASREMRSLIFHVTLEISS